MLDLLSVYRGHSRKLARKLFEVSRAELRLRVFHCLFKVTVPLGARQKVSLRRIVSQVDGKAKLRRV